MKIIGIDVGTTNIKAGLFSREGAVIRTASRPTNTHQNERGHYFYKPEEIWDTVCAVIREATSGGDAGDVAAVGIASMAEAGLLVDRESGQPKSDFIPWFDTRTAKQAEQVGREAAPLERFAASGLRVTFKQGLSKLLWLRENEAADFTGAKWLSVSDYIAYRLTGKMATDYSLAARTFAFRIDRKEWDVEWIRHFGLDPALFPQAMPAGTPIGQVVPALAERLGIGGQAVVAIGGHDHVCASLSVGAIAPGKVFDSMGTAETLVGMLRERPLGKRDFATGLSYGCHIVAGNYFWMGSIQSSGGSIEWLRSLLSDTKLSYDQIVELLVQTKAGPSGILYYPYLSGSGAPQPDSRARASFIGISKSHGKGDLLKAVLEGTSYEMESIRRAAEGVSGEPIEELAAVGGGTRSRAWMQMKSDVSGCRIGISPVSEATMLGAALAAGIGAGLYRDAAEASECIRAGAGEGDVVSPDATLHNAYQRVYSEGYMPLHEPLRSFFSKGFSNE